MAQLSTKAIKAFNEIYLQEFHVELSEDKAQEIASEFLKCFSLIYRPLEIKEENEKREEKEMGKF